MSGAMELLEWCRGVGLKTAVVTNGRDHFQRSKIAGMGMLPLLDQVFTSGGFGQKKPSHSIFLACLDALGVEPKSAAMVGDDLVADIKPAFELKMIPVYKGMPPCLEASYAAEDLSSITAFLKRVA
jgi:putative hydrolase of the HAD superfamily